MLKKAISSNKVYIANLHSLFSSVGSQNSVIGFVSSAASTVTIVNASIEIVLGTVTGFESHSNLLECRVLFPLSKLRSNLWCQISAPVSWLRLKMWLAVQ